MISAERSAEIFTFAERPAYNRTEGILMKKIYLKMLAVFLCILVFAAALVLLLYLEKDQFREPEAASASASLQGDLVSLSILQFNFDFLSQNACFFDSDMI